MKSPTVPVVLLAAAFTRNPEVVAVILDSGEDAGPEDKEGRAAWD